MEYTFFFMSIKPLTIQSRLSVSSSLLYPETSSRRRCSNSSLVILLRCLCKFTKTDRIFNVHLCTQVTISPKSRQKSTYKKSQLLTFNKLALFWCLGRESNPHGHFWPRDFKSLVSTIPPPGPVIKGEAVVPPLFGFKRSAESYLLKYLLLSITLRSSFSLLSKSFELVTFSRQMRAFSTSPFIR